MVEAMEIQAGFKQTKVGVIPSDWQITELGSIADITKLAGFEYSKYFNSYKDGGDIIVLRGTNITRNELDLSDVKTIPRSTSNNLQRSKLFKNDLVFAYVGTIGPIYLVRENNRFHLGPNTSKITLKKSYDPQFIFSYFKSWLIKKEIFENTSIGAQPSLSMSKIRKFKINLPPTKAEQTAIATALNDADALITQLEKLIAKKRAIKQGAMQELLKPKEGCDMKKLGEVAHLQGGFAFKSDLFVEIGIPIIRISDVKNDKVDTSESVCYEPFNIPRDFIVYAGDVLIAMSGATTGKIGIYQSEKIAYLNQRVGKFVVKDYLRTDKVYLSHLVRSEKFKENLIKEIAQGAQPNISGKQIENLELPILNKKFEQTRIAQILSDMDTEIEALEKKLNKYKMIKQGMMQNLLTGRIRLV